MKKTFCRPVFVAFVLSLLVTAGAVCALASESEPDSSFVHLEYTGFSLRNCIATPDGNFIIQQRKDKMRPERYGSINSEAETPWKTVKPDGKGGLHWTEGEAPWTIVKLTPEGEVLWAVDGVLMSSAVALSDGSVLIVDGFEKKIVRVLDGSVVSEESIPAANPDAKVECTLLPATGGYMVCVAERADGNGDTAIRCYSEDGTQRWTQVFRNMYFTPRSALPYQGGYLLYGMRQFAEDDKLPFREFAMRLDGNGSSRWNWMPDTMPIDSGAVLPNGDLLFLGGINSNFISFIATRLDENGEQVWQREYNFDERPITPSPTSIIPWGESYLAGFYSKHYPHQKLCVFDGEGTFQRRWMVNAYEPSITFEYMEILRTQRGIYLLGSDNYNFIIQPVQLRDITPPDPLTATPADVFWYGSYDYCLKDGKVTILRYSGSDEDLSIPDSIHGYPVTEIGESAFEGCVFIRRVTIPEGVATVGKNAFKGTTLREIALPGSLAAIGEGAFYSCTLLDAVVIPDGVVTIGDSAFENTNLSKVTIPAGVAEMGANPFSRCGNLSRIDVSKENPFFISDGGVLYAKQPQVLISFPPMHSKKTYKILKGTLEIGDSAFEACARLTGVTLPDSLVSIGDGAFEYCEKLKSIKIPDSVTSVGDWAFSYCYSLNSAALSRNAIISKRMFFGCEKLAGLTIPNGVTAIETQAFDGCANLERLTIPSSVTSIPPYDFKEYDFPKLTFHVTTDSYAAEYAMDNNIPYKLFTEKDGKKPPKPVDTPPPAIDDDDWFPNPAYEDGGWFGTSDDDDAFGYEEAEVFPGMFVGDECWEAIPATLNQRMATRTGPGTKFTEVHGVLPQSTEIVVYAKEVGGSATWALVEFVKKGKLVRAYTGMKRIDADADSIPAAEEPESAMVTVDTAAFYGPGQGYLELKGPVKKGTKVQVYGIDKGFALIEYAVGNAWTRSWVPEETLAVQYQ